MHFLRLVQASACILSLPFSEARISNILAQRLGLIKREVCVEDEWLAAVRAEPNAQVSCSEFRTSANATVTAYVTPTLTTTVIRTTSTLTLSIATRVTSTVTVTPASIVPKYKRAPAPTKRAVLNKRATAAENVNAVFDLARAEAASDSGGLDPFVSSLFSIITSACDCLSYGPLFTTTVTSTEIPDIKVKTAWTETTTEVTSTSIVRTVTVTASPMSDIASSTFISTSTLTVTPVPVSSDTPIGYDYNCPADNNTTQTFVVGSDIFTFHLFCNSSFANESSLTTSPAASEGDCISQCAAADELARAPLCKGFSFDGVSCALYGDALYSHFVATNGVDSAILLEVKGQNSTIQNRTVGSEEGSSVFASITQGVTFITPPPVSDINAIATTSCFRSTFTDSADGVVRWTEGCSSSSAWWAAWTVSATLIYFSQTAVYGVGSGGGGAGGFEGGSGGASGFSGQTITQITATATSGQGAASTGAGAFWESTLTTVVSGSTYVTVITGGASGGGSGHNATGSVINSSLGETGGADSGMTATGGVLTPVTSTITTISGESTVTFITTYFTNGSGSGYMGTGGVISATPWNFSTSLGEASTQVTVISGETGGQGSGNTGTGGVLPTSGNFTRTIVNATTLTFIGTGQSSGGGAGSTGTGGIITPVISQLTPTVNGSAPIYYSTFFNATTAVSTGGTNGGTEGSTGTGGIIIPTSNGTFSRTPSEKPRSGSASPSGTAPASESWTPYPNITWSHAGTEKSRSGSQFPYPSPNSTWLGETHPPVPTGKYHGYPPFNYTLTPLGTGTAPTTSDTDTFWRSKTEKPRTGSQSPSGPSEFPYPTPNSTWLGETHPAPSTPTTTERSRNGSQSLSGLPFPTSNSTVCISELSTVTQTIYLNTENCPCPTPSFPGYGGTPSYTYMTSPTLSSSTSGAPISAVPSIDQQRKAGENATAAQIEASCKYVGNQIFNGEFELQDSNGFPLGWGFSSTSAAVQISSHEDAGQHTPGGSRDARIESTNATALARFYQPLTLCPNATYALTAWTRQPRVLAECLAVFNIGNVEIGRVSPGQVWGKSVFNSKTYTVGPTAADAAVDIEVGVQCRGSADSWGKRVVEFDDMDLSVVL